MKKNTVAVICITFCLCIFFSACDKEKNDILSTPTPSTATPAKTENKVFGITDDDLAIIEYVYVSPLLEEVWNYSWGDVSEIQADHLVLTCYKSNYFGLGKDYEGVYYESHADADIVEWSVQQHFAVESEYLRTSSFYNPETESYKLIGGFGGGFSAVAISVEQRDTRIVIEVGILGSYTDRELLPGEILLPNGILTPKGTLTVELIYGRQVEYVSFEAIE